MTTFKFSSFKHTVVAFVLLALSYSPAAAQNTAPNDDPNNPVITERARAIHNSAIVVDTHADTPQRFLDENFDIGNADPKTLDTSPSIKRAREI
jgi:membrane dipeptidase